MAEQLGEAVLTISADTTALDAGLQRAKTSADGLKQAFSQLTAGISFAGTLAYIGDQVKQLDAANAAVSTLGVNTSDLGTRLRALSVELGNSVSQIDLTKAAYDVASSGFSNAADSTNVLRAAVLGSQGGFADLNDVVQAVTGVLNAYGLASSNASSVVDKFIQTQNDGVLTVRQYAGEIGNIASVAAAAGVSLDEINAAIATATLKGVPVQQAFTGLGQALSSIIDPSDRATAVAKSLGIEFNVNALNAKGLAGVLTDIQKNGGAAADKLAVLLGSTEAQSAIQPLLNDKLATYNNLLEKQATSSGAAANAAKTNSQTISSGLDQIGKGFSNLATTLDTTLTPLLGGFLASINEILIKLNQVSALSPDKVLAREKQASDIVQQAIGPFGGSGFFGNVNVDFEGKKYSGSATGVRNEILNSLLQKELAAVNQQATNFKNTNDDIIRQQRQQEQLAAGLATQQKNIAAETQKELNTRLQINTAALLLQNSQNKLAAVQATPQLDSVGRVALQNQLELNQQINAVKADQLQLNRELAKPEGTGDGKDGTQNAAKIFDLQQKIQRGQVDVTTTRIQNQQADAAALRTQQDRVRLNELDAANAEARLNATQDLATAEGTRAVVLQNQLSIGEKLRAQSAAQAAVSAEQAKPVAQQDVVVLDDLFIKLSKANADVRQAYADAGAALLVNVQNAAKELIAAKSAFQSTLQGGFQFLTPELQKQAITNARAAIQPLVDQGVIATGIDISTPDKLFQLADFANSFTAAEGRLKKALDENARATAALTNKNWNIYINKNGSVSQTSSPTSGTSQGAQFSSTEPSPYDSLGFIQVGNQTVYLKQ